MAIVGLLVLSSLSQTSEKTNPFARVLAKEVDQIHFDLQREGHTKQIVVPQRSVSIALKELKLWKLIYHDVGRFTVGNQPSFEQVVAEATEVLEQAHVARVVVVANPILARRAKKMVAERFPVPIEIRRARLQGYGIRRVQP